MLEELLTYFNRPGEPCEELVHLRQVVLAEHDVPQEVAARITWYAYAWLDMRLRNDLADAARTAAGVWEIDQLSIETARYRHRRVQELIARARPASLTTGGRLAASVTTRRRKRDSNAG